MKYRLRIEKTEKDASRGKVSPLLYIPTILLLGALGVSYLDKKVFTKSNKPNYVQQQAVQQTQSENASKQSDRSYLANFRPRVSDDYLAAATKAIIAGDNTNAANLSRDYILEAFIEDKAPYENIERIFSQALSRGNFSADERRKYLAILEGSRNASNFSDFINSVDLEPYKTDVNSIASRRVENKIYGWVDNNNMSWEEKMQNATELEKSLGTKNSMNLVQLMKGVNPNNNQLMNIGSLILQICGGSAFGDFNESPITGVLKLLENSSYTRVPQEMRPSYDYAQQSRGSRYVPEGTYYDNLGRPVDPSSLVRDRFGNPISVTGEPYKTPTHNLDNYTQSTRRIEGKTGGSREETNVWILPGTKQQKEQEKWNNLQPNKNDPRSKAPRDAFDNAGKAAVGAVKGVNNALSNMFQQQKKPPEKKKK